ncbi:MAG: hypothetical protein JSW10_04450 [Pseudomonadota bacterium]|nr:MAG: hypothetical protein JSW10_04450 [Pseudomonadota bacterium]
MQGFLQAMCGAAMALLAITTGANEAQLRAEQASDAQSLRAEQEAYRTRLAPHTPRAEMKLQNRMLRERLQQQQLHQRQRSQALYNRAGRPGVAPGDQALRNAQRLQFRSEQAAQRQSLRIQRNSLPGTGR